MEQNLKNNQNEFLWTLLANPANDAHLYAYDLQKLVNDFPQSGVLQGLLAHASDNKNLRQASVYFNPRSLFKLVNAPSAFVGVPHERIFIQANLRSNEIYQSEETPLYNETLNEYKEEAIDNNADELHLDTNAPVIETEAEHVHHIAQEAEIEHKDESTTPAFSIAGQPAVETEAQNQETAAVESPEKNTVSETPEAPEIAVIEPEIVEAIYDDRKEPATVEEHADKPVQETQTVQPGPQVDEEVAPEHEAPPEPYTHEIESGRQLSPVDEDTLPQHNEHNEFPEPVIHEAAPEQPFSPIAETAGDENEKPIAIINPSEKDEHPGIVPEIHLNESTYREPEIKAPDDIDETFDEIVGIDDINFNSRSTGDKYFSFDQEFGSHEDADGGNNQAVEEEAKAAAPGNVDKQDLSKYNDDEMPYTFMWWLDKTRKEHALAHQPYVKPTAPAESKKPKKVTDELQHQYFENIFHITSVEELDQSPAAQPAPYVVKRKEQVIIERFIKEEPQIKPQSSDKLDNENKAKKSSEDRDELVTETLASIYSDQMLYHKAIASYKKLMLRFPEKSRYFAVKIEQLEKKTN